MRHTICLILCCLACPVVPSTSGGEDPDADNPGYLATPVGIGEFLLVNEPYEQHEVTLWDSEYEGYYGYEGYPGRRHRMFTWPTGPSILEDQISDPVGRVIEQREALIRTLQELQDAYCKAGMLDEAIEVREQIRRLQSESLVPLPPLPRESATKLGNSDFGRAPYELRGHDGKVFYLQATGSTSGTIWGAGIYTDDSDLGTAAVHAGLLQPGQTRVLAVRILPGRDYYPAAEAHGVESRIWGLWGGSFEIVGAGVLEEEFQRDQVTVEAEVTLVYTTGRSAGGWVWGSDVYTDDSNLGTAAVHAGALKPGEAGFVVVEVLPGLERYESSTRHGVTTSPYGPWPRSLRLSPWTIREVAEEPAR